tara:strand:- start:2197 stop:2418 length:222 start_codon:yes stop_codon:yes gene_type:complete
MTEQEDYIRKLEARIEKLEKKVETINADLNSLEDEMPMGGDLAKAIHEIQQEMQKQGITIINPIYAPNMVGGV